MADVAALLGLEFDATPALAPDELVARLDLVLAAAQRFVRQLPPEVLDQDVLERKRPYRELAYHLFRIPDAFVEVTIEAGGEVARDDLNRPAPETIRTVDEIAEYGAAVRRRVRRWWTGEDDRACARIVPTYWGAQPLHHVLERMTWHPAQHARQLMMLLDRLGIAPDRPLRDADLAGLPLPEKVWDE